MHSSLLAPIRSQDESVRATLRCKKVEIESWDPTSECRRLQIRHPEPRTLRAKYEITHPVMPCPPLTPPLKSKPFSAAAGFSCDGEHGCKPLSQNLLLKERHSTAAHGLHGLRFRFFLPGALSRAYKARKGTSSRIGT